MRLFPLVLAPVLALAALVSACRLSSGEPSTAMELRTYDVPKGTIRPLATMIKDSLYLDEGKTIGRATMTPDGRLAILAPHNVQEGVQQLIAEVIKHPPTHDQTIDMHYYVVLGKPSSKPEPPPAGAVEIQGALDEIVRTQGPQTFTVAQRIELSSLNDEKSHVQADQLRVTQLAVQTPDGVYARIDVEFAKVNTLETRVHLVPGRIVVLGAAGQRAGDTFDGSTLYYIVRVAPRADGPRP